MRKTVKVTEVPKALLLSMEIPYLIQTGYGRFAHASRTIQTQPGALVGLGLTKGLANQLANFLDLILGRKLI